MTNKYVIDTSAWIAYFDGGEKAKALSHIIETETIVTSLLAITELADKFSRENRSFTTHFNFVRSRSTLLSINIDICLNAAKLKQKIRITRLKFGLVDALQLATAQDEQAQFVTADNDFRGVDNVMMI